MQALVTLEWISPIRSNARQISLNAISLPQLTLGQCLEHGTAGTGADSTRLPHSPYGVPAYVQLLQKPCHAHAAK